MDDDQLLRVQGAKLKHHEEKKMKDASEIAKIVDEIVSLVGDPSFTTIPSSIHIGPAEALVGQYAACSVKDLHGKLHPLLEAWTYIEEIAKKAKKRFNCGRAEWFARELLIKRALHEAHQELGKDAKIAEVVARAAGNNYKSHLIWEGGMRSPNVHISDICEAACGRMEYQVFGLNWSVDDRYAFRWYFADKSAIVAHSDCWDIEGGVPFIMASDPRAISDEEDDVDENEAEGPAPVMLLT